METRQILSDFDHPSIVDKANELTGSTKSTEQNIEAIFQFVRDGIKFGFPPKWDIVKASEVLRDLSIKVIFIHAERRSTFMDRNRDRWNLDVN